MFCVAAGGQTYAFHSSSRSMQLHCLTRPLNYRLLQRPCHTLDSSPAYRLAGTLLRGACSMLRGACWIRPVEMTRVAVASLSTWTWQEAISHTKCVHGQGHSVGPWAWWEMGDSRAWGCGQVPSIPAYCIPAPCRSYSPAGSNGPGGTAALRAPPTAQDAGPQLQRPGGRAGAVPAPTGGRAPFSRQAVTALQRQCSDCKGQGTAAPCSRSMLHG